MPRELALQLIRFPCYYRVLLLFVVLPSLTLAAPRYGVPYPDSVCVHDCLVEPLPCPGQTCPDPTPTACNRYDVPATDPMSDSRPWTYCMPNFHVPCTTDRLGCIRCALMQVALNNCVAQEGCTDHGSYAVFLSRETNATTGLKCQTQAHWMLVPKRACVGIESTDLLCTGRKGEAYWAATWATALAKGYDPAAGNTWGALLNAINSRSQHQIHFRISNFKGSDERPQRNGVVEAFQQVQTFSTEWRQPTITWGNQSAMFASVFFPANTSDPSMVAKVVRPFYWASKIAKVSMGQNVYGILLTPWAQPSQKSKKKEGLVGSFLASNTATTPTTGFVLTVYFNVRSTVMLSERLAEPLQCIDGCAA